MINDPLHPKYGKEDGGWNAEWHYENERKGNIWRCVISVPFASINAAVPEPGVRWAMNIGRQAYTSPKMKWAGECALWSPNFESMSMSDNLNAFGDVTFE